MVLSSAALISASVFATGYEHFSLAEISAGRIGAVQVFELDISGDPSLPTTATPRIEWSTAQALLARSNLLLLPTGHYQRLDIAGTLDGVQVESVLASGVWPDSAPANPCAMAKSGMAPRDGVNVKVGAGLVCTQLDPGLPQFVLDTFSHPVLLLPFGARRPREFTDIHLSTMVIGTDEIDAALRALGSGGGAPRAVVRPKALELEKQNNLRHMRDRSAMSVAYALLSGAFLTLIWLVHAAPELKREYMLRRCLGQETFCKVWLWGQVSVPAILKSCALGACLGLLGVSRALVCAQLASGMLLLDLIAVSAASALWIKAWAVQ